MSEVDDLLAVAEQTVQDAEKAVQEAEELLAEARIDRDAIRRTVTRLRGSAPPKPVVTSPAEQTAWREMTRPEAILRMLLLHTGPMSPEELRVSLIEAGRTGETPAGIYSALGRLDKRGQIKSVGRGAWVRKN